MNDLILSPLSLEKLKTELSESILSGLSAHLQNVSNPQPPTELMTRREASKLLGVSLPTLLNWTKTGKITGYRIASQVRYKRTELENSLFQIRTK